MRAVRSVRRARRKSPSATRRPCICSRATPSSASRAARSTITGRIFPVKWEAAKRSAGSKASRTSMRLRRQEKPASSTSVRPTKGWPASSRSSTCRGVCRRATATCASRTSMAASMWKARRKSAAEMSKSLPQKEPWCRTIPPASSMRAAIPSPAI